MTKFDTATSNGFQQKFLDRFAGNRKPATAEDLSLVYASLIGLVDVMLTTHRVVVNLPLTDTQREVFSTATQDMNTLIETVWKGIDVLEKVGEE